jgi:hypothetical protein
MFVTLTREGGSPAMLTFKAARKQLAPETDPLLVCAELACGTTVSVMLMDGTSATLRMSEDKPDPDPFQPEFPIDALRPTALGSLRPLTAHCKVMLELSVDIQCLAIDEVHAEQIITSVVRGERNPPPGFTVVFDAEGTHDFLRRVRSVFEGDALAQAGVGEVLVTGFSEPQRQLEYRP